MAVDWPSLPLDLLADIAMKMEIMEDFVYFSAVCRSWNCASSSIKHKWRPIPMPRLLLAGNTSNNYSVRKVFNPSNKKCCTLNLNLPDTLGARFWGSGCGWVAMVNRDLNVRLFNPITKAEIYFPSAKTLPHRRHYDEKDFGGKESYIDWFLMHYLIRLVVLKVSENEFVLVVIYGYYGRVVWAKPGDKSWTLVYVNEDPTIRLFDVAAMDDYVFAVFHDAALVYWNIEDFLGHELVKPMDCSLSVFENIEEFTSGMGKPYLVQSGSDLLMVLRFKDVVLNEEETDYNYDIVYETFGFSVYRLDLKDKNWEEIEDYATLFVGGNTTMSVSAKCLEPNKIYFTDDEYEHSIHVRLPGHDMGVYDPKSDEISRFYEGDDISSVYCRPTWFIPQL